MTDDHHDDRDPPPDWLRLAEPDWGPAMRRLEADTGLSAEEMEAEIALSREEGEEEDEEDGGVDGEWNRSFWRDSVRDGLQVYWRHVDDRFGGTPGKTRVTLRIDNDVLEWLRRYGKGYQSLTNAALRAFMMACVKAR